MIGGDDVVLLLRRGIGGGALRRGCVRPWRPFRLLRIADDFRDAKVRYLHRPGLVDKEVFRFDIAMHNAVIVGTLQGIANRRDDPQGFLRREAFGLQQLAEIHAVHKLHKQKIEAACLPEVMHPDDVRVIERGERMGLFFKPGRKLRIIGPLRCEQFQCHEPVQGLLPCLVNDAHAAASEAFEDFELREVRGKFPGGKQRNGGSFISWLRGLHGPGHEAAGAAAIDRISGKHGTAERAGGI